MMNTGCSGRSRTYRDKGSSGGPAAKTQQQTQGQDSRTIKPDTAPMESIEPTAEQVTLSNFIHNNTDDTELQSKISQEFGFFSTASCPTEVMEMLAYPALDRHYNWIQKIRTSKPTPKQNRHKAQDRQTGGNGEPAKPRQEFGFFSTASCPTEVMEMLAYPALDKHYNWVSRQYCNNVVDNLEDGKVEAQTKVKVEDLNTEITDEELGPRHPVPDTMVSPDPRSWEQAASGSQEDLHGNQMGYMAGTRHSQMRQTKMYRSTKLMNTTTCMVGDMSGEEEARTLEEARSYRKRKVNTEQAVTTVTSEPELKLGKTLIGNGSIPVVEEGCETASPESGTQMYEHTIYIDGDNVPTLCSNIDQTQIDPGIQVRFVCNTSFPMIHLEALDKSVHKEIVKTKDNASDIRIVRRVSETRAKYPKKHLIRIISRDKGFEQMTPFVVNLDIKEPSQENIFKLENHKSTNTTLLETVFKAIRSNPYLNGIVFVQHSSRNDVRKWDGSERYTYRQPTQLKKKLREKLQGKNVMVLMFYKKSNLIEWEYWFQCLLNQHKNFFPFGSTREDGSIFQLLTSVISIHNHLHLGVDFSVYSDKGEDMPLEAEIHSSCQGRHILIYNEQRLTMGT